MTELKFSVHAESPLHELSPIVVLAIPVQASSPWHFNGGKVGSRSTVGFIDGLGVVRGVGIGEEDEAIFDGADVAASEESKVVGADVAASEESEGADGADVVAGEGAEGTADAEATPAADTVFELVSLVPSTAPIIIAKTTTTIPVQSKAHQRRVLEPSSSTTSACATPCPISPRNLWNF